MQELTILSPAKINLNLRVTGVRDDGFHNTDSLVQPVGIFDEVHISISNHGSVVLNSDFCGAFPLAKNTAYIAAKLFLQESRIERGVEIFLKKTVPAGAGLGGGSGNAAAVLVGLNRVFEVFEYEDLCRIGYMVGSDVPLFIRCETCRISGAGERIEHLEDFPLFHYVVCFPGFECRTADVYRKWDDLKLHGELPSRGEKMWRVNPAVEMENDLESAAFALYPELGRFRSLIEEAGNVPFLMTGSGSAFFSVFEDGFQAAEVFERVKKAGGFRCFPARGVEGWL